MKLEIKDLTVDIKNTGILEGISLGLEEKEFLVLLGPSGCGKSTLLKTIAGIVPVKEGTIMLDGKILNDVPHLCGRIRCRKIFPEFLLCKSQLRRRRLAWLAVIQKSNHFCLGDGTGLQLSTKESDLI